MPKKFAFIVHPRNMFDLYQRFPFFRIIPLRFLSVLLKYLPPVYVTSIKGLKDLNGEKRDGEIISITLTAKQMLEDKDLAKKHVIKAIKKAHSRGATHIGLGAFTSVVTSGGEDVRGLIPNVYITNGNALTAYVTYTNVKELIEEFKNGKPTVAIIGATGSIGSVVTEMLVKHGVSKAVYIVGRNPSRIKGLLEKLTSHIYHTSIQHVSLEEALPKSDIVVSATSADGAVIHANLLKKGAIIYDITQPKNILAEVINERPDVSIFDGGLTLLPKGVKIPLNMGVPKTTIFSCLGETMLTSLSNFPGDFALGHITLNQVEYIEKLAKQFQFVPAKKIIWKKGY